MATHYFACSWPMTLEDIQFSQHHTMHHQLYLTLGAKGLSCMNLTADLFQVLKVNNRFNGKGIFFF
jgi:hypothetical protein